LWKTTVGISRIMKLDFGCDVLTDSTILGPKIK
jgi:hypothetical protein